MAYFLKKINKLKSPFMYLGVLPIIVGIADYLENIGIGSFGLPSHIWKEKTIFHRTSASL